MNYKLTDQDLMDKYEERMAICVEDGFIPTLYAKKEARVECLDALIAEGAKRSDATYRLHGLREKFKEL